MPWPFRPTAAQPLSTFSIDVDTASLSHARRYLTAGRAASRATSSASRRS
ncbi:MAG: von Willebrand factor type A domain-containing protein [Deltaproteobacteria bacterium]|nr:von Willebrand factor type A domain-containing protein [Deltaproteobacteria bacterium]